MRVWIDLTNSPHVLVMRPVIELLRADGHDVRVTARDFAQTLALCERLGIEHTAIGHHRGERLGAKAVGLASRSAALVRWARADVRAAGGRRFDIALGHGSNDVSVAAALLRVPSSTMFDYEWATVQHTINCRLASAVVVPEAIPPERLRRYGATGKLRRYEGLKEEYYLADFEPDAAVLGELGLDREKVLVVVRPPPETSEYHARNDLYDGVIQRLAGSAEVQAVVIPRTERQAEELRRLNFANLRVPERAIDAQSLIAYADLVVSAGGTMNREAVALDTPVFTTFAGRMGGVDEALIEEDRLRVLEHADELPLRKRESPVGVLQRRDPDLLVEGVLGAAEVVSGLSR